MKRQFQYVVPVLHVSDLVSAIEFFQAIGFECEWKWGDPPCYAGCYSGTDQVIHLQQREGVAPGATELYLQVESAEQFLEVCKSAGHTILVPLADQQYGMRDFTVEGPDGIRVTFGQELD